MTTPTFFSWDNFELYPVGAISSMDKQFVWAAPGVFNSLLTPYPRDNFDSYTDGSISSTNAGTDWVAAGNFTTYPNT